VKYENPTIGMCDFLNIHPKSHCLKELFCHGHRVVESSRSDDWSWRLVGDTKQKNAAPFVRQCHTVFEQFVVVELGFCLLELQALVL